MAAYGLYTHIQSNKRRSIALLIGLFILVYVMVFAGALLAEALSTYNSYNAPLRTFSAATFCSTPGAATAALRAAITASSVPRSCAA
jgi:hypothetical protein